MTYVGTGWELGGYSWQLGHWNAGVWKTWILTIHYSLYAALTLTRNNATFTLQHESTLQLSECNVLLLEYLQCTGKEEKLCNCESRVGEASLTYLHTHSLAYFPTRLWTRSCKYPLTYLNARSFIQSHWYIYSLTYLLTYVDTYPLKCLLSYLNTY